MKPMPSKIAVVGSKGSVMGFRAVGFDVVEADTPHDIAHAVDRLARENYGVVFLTEQALAKAPQVMEKYRTERSPAVIPIPGREGSLGIGMQNLHKCVERAVGADILSS